MDVQQLRSWIFELYEPLDDDRQYVVFDTGRGNLMIDIPPYSERAVRSIRGTGRNTLLLVTNAVRARGAGRFRDELGVRLAAHADDAGAIPGGPDITLGESEILRPDVRTVRVRDGAHGATVALLTKAGGVLVVGDLDLSREAARPLLDLEFSAILSASRPPVWSAGKDALRATLGELPRPRKSFGILMNTPWDRAYLGRLQDQMKPNPLIPQEETAVAQAGMGPTTLVVSQTTPAKQAQAPAPERP